MSHAEFAMSWEYFAISSFWGACRFAFSFSLFKSLKKKKKEGKEARKTDFASVPRVGDVLPSILVVAYFLGHEFHEPAITHSWQLMAKDVLQINELNQNTMLSISPRVALRVVPPRIRGEKGQ